MTHNLRPNTAQIRKLLNTTFDDPGLDAFCQDYFYDVFNRFSSGMRKDVKITLLLDHCWRIQSGFEKLFQAIHNEYEVSGSQRDELKVLIEAIKALTKDIIISEDGRIIPDDEALHSPLPQFDSSVLDNLDPPTGAVKLRSKFYIERRSDVALKREVMKLGTTTTIYAPRQTGKSSLLMRGVHHARVSGVKTVALSLQNFGHDRLVSPDIFLRELAEWIVRKLRLDVLEIEKLWRGSLGPQSKLTYLIEDYILHEVNAPIILALDEADLLLQTSFYKDFFAMLRSWHDRRVLDEEWNRLNIVMVISTEPYMLIQNSPQSPFNVGIKLLLKDFNEAQVYDLNRRHGFPVAESDFPQLMKLLNGHPYLTRVALYTLVIERATWTELTRLPTANEGPFGEHLWHHYLQLRDDRKLREALKEIIRDKHCSDETVLIRLLKAGLVKGQGDVYTCRCDLYRMYFEDKL